MHNHPTHHHSKVLIQRAGSLFEWLWLKGQLWAVIASFTKQSREIPFLSNEDFDSDVLDIEQVGVHPIRVLEIKGTVGRMNYDKDFYPLQRRDKRRWMSVAVAMMGDVTSLAPISVVEFEQKYYTSDGNHRVSVARALDKLYIDANITRWDIKKHRSFSQDAPE